MSEEKTIKEEIEEQSLTVTINLKDYTFKSSRPMTSLALRSHLRMFIEILMLNDIMATVDANFMKKLGLKNKHN